LNFAKGKKLIVDVNSEQPANASVVTSELVDRPMHGQDIANHTELELESFVTLQE
jgi:hypothetical protein